MRRYLVIYNFILLTILIVAALVQARRGTDFLYALVFLPLCLYFGRILYYHLRRRRRPSLQINPATPPAGKLASLTITTPPTILEGETVDDADVQDINRRMFLKLIGSAGLATFVFALFSKSAHAAFFGSVPGPGTVALKDSSGNKIDPAEKQPTDGYEISQVDDAAIPAYYGFLNRDGAWYIAREGNGGEYRYARGSSSFSTSWTNRTNLSYAYFDSVF